MKKIFRLLFIIFSIIPVYSNNFIINTSIGNIDTSIENINKENAIPAFNVLQKEGNLAKIQAKLDNNPAAKKILNELKNYLIVNNEVNFRAYNPIPIRKITLDTLEASNLIDKTAINLQSSSNQWHLNACNVSNAWQTATGKGIIVAVLDTGIDYFNYDFDGQLWFNAAEDINHNGRYDSWLSTEERDGVFGDIDGIDNDGNGYVDDVIGFDFVNEMIPTIYGDVKDIDGNPLDKHGHGTQVSSVISSKQSSNEVVGVAYDAKIMAIKTHNDIGQSDCIAIANGIIYAVLNGANVINLSSGETEDSPLIHTAIKFAIEIGVVVVCSSGNDGNTLPHYPSDYSEVISVGGINENKQRVFNYGDFIDITAPAINIYVGNKNNTYRKNNGTSFSAPIVSGICALLLSKNVDLSPAEIKTQLQLTAISETGWTSQFGSGIVDAKKSLDFIGKATLQIEAPKQYDIVNISTQDSLIIKGTIAMLLFDNYVVRIKNCREDKKCQWDTLIDKQYSQVISSELCKINFKEKNIPLGENIISVVCNLKSGKTIEERISIIFIDSTGFIADNLIIDNKVIRAYYNNNLVDIVNVKTQYPTTAKLFWKPINTTYNDRTNFINSVDYITNNHIFITDNLSHLLNDGMHKYEYYVEVKYGDISQTIPIELISAPTQINNVASAQMVKQKYSMPIGHLYNKPIHKSNSNKDLLVASYFDENGSPLKTNFIENDGDSLKVFNQSSKNSICIATDENSILTGYYGALELYELTTDNKFGKIKYSIGEENSLNNSYVGIGLFDLDNDGQNDALYRDNDGNFYVVFDATNRKKVFNYYEFVKQNANIDLFSSHNRITTCFGNFYGNKNYGDNKNYLAILTSNDTYLSIIELTNDIPILKEIIPLTDHYHNELTHNNHNLNQDIFMQKGDIDGDGIDELIYMYYGKINDTSDVLGKYEVWTIHIYKSENGHLNEIATEDILGVRVGNYENGLNTGDIDNDNKDEILICSYPNLYVFKWNNEDKKLFLYWYAPECNSNTAVVGDFNGNGKNEICFNNFIGTIFFEFEKDKPQTIFNFKGYAYNNNSAVFHWESYADNTAMYELFIIETDNLLSGNNEYIKYTTSKKSIDIIDLLLPKTYYTAFVRIKGDSALYNPIKIYTNDITFPISAEAINNKIIKIKFSERIDLDNNNGIKLIANNDSILSSVNLTTHKDSALIAEFDKEIPNGNYKLEIPIFTDIYGNQTRYEELNISINFVNTIELFLASLVYEPPLTLIIKFSEPIDSTALKINNYTLKPYGSIENISFIDSNTIKMLLSKSTEIDGRGKDYLLIANPNITANSGNKMTSGTGNTLGFSIYADNFNSIYVYPAPISLAKHKEVYIAHLPNNVNIEILNQFGKVIKTLQETDGNGGIDWDLMNEQNNKCDVGIYFIRIIDKISDEQKLIKFVITK